MKILDKSKGELVEIKRETKTLKLVSVTEGDYYNSKYHDEFVFTDGKNTYIYHGSLNADRTDYDHKFAAELAFEEGKLIKFSGNFVPWRLAFPSSLLKKNKYFIYIPRLIEVIAEE